MIRTVSGQYFYGCLQRLHKLIIDARSLFENTISTLPAANARLIWECWTQYQYQYADLEAVLKLEKRMADIYPTGTLVPVGVVSF